MGIINGYAPKDFVRVFIPWDYSLNGGISCITFYAQNMVNPSTEFLYIYKMCYTYITHCYIILSTKIFK